MIIFTLCCIRRW